ncbi:MAG: LysR family transcriptional regulator [Silicimonas sp.]|nr:LysR family transcriptional regulator [Silicimonas sp.]
MILNLPYISLRAFEAVSRHGSFSGAADELGVSQSAVSQHVKTLEEWLGHPLMNRGARRSAPTRDGARLARAISEGLGRISEVCEDIRDKRRTDNTIVISCLPGFAFIWLFPRLLTFDLAHPHLTVSITTDTGTTSFTATEVDIGIRYGNGNNPGFVVEPLMGEDLVPVCAPSLLQGEHPLSTVADLAHHTLIRDEFAPFTRNPPSWEYWARANDLKLPRPARTRRFGQSNMVIQAAIEGVGVALGRGPLVIDALMSGRLVRPFAETARSQLKYWLVCGEAQSEVEKNRLFIDWIKAEAAALPELPEPASTAQKD